MLRPTIAIAGLLFIFGVVGGAFFWLSNTGPNDPISRAAAPFEYDLVGWEWRHLANRWLYRIGHLFDEGPSEEEQDDMVRRYFALADEVVSSNAIARRTRPPWTRSAASSSGWRTRSRTSWRGGSRVSWRTKVSRPACPSSPPCALCSRP